MDTSNVVTIHVNASNSLGEQPHNWNYIGYDEINYTYTPEGQALLGKFQALSDKPYYVRVHHLLCTGNCHGFYKWGSTNAYLERDGQPEYDWSIVDLVFDTLLQYDCKPFVELGFMPLHLADPDYYQINEDTWTYQQYRSEGFACPPKDYEKWYDLIFHLVQHCRERYGDDEIQTWYWELWNEPDLDYYWKGSIEEFNKLYDYTASAVKDACPSARVGGPGTTNPQANKTSGEYLNAFLDHCANGRNAHTGERGTAIDFISFHVKGGGYSADPLHRKQTPPSVKRILDDVRTGYDIISRYPTLTDLECVLTEIDPDGWAAGGKWDNANLNFRNTPYYASFVASTFYKLTAFAQSVDWDLRFLSWAFMFVGERCFEGTRAFSTQGIDKAILNLFRIYSRMGDQAIQFDSSGAQDHNSEQPDVAGFATLDDTNTVSVLIYSHHDNWDKQGHDEIQFTLENLPFPTENIVIEHYRIDENHSNAYSEWVRQGEPMYPTSEQYDAIKSRDSLELLDTPYTLTREGQTLTLQFSLPVHSISLLQITAN